MHILRINAKEAPQPEGGYSQALAVEGATRLLFISGQIPETLDAEVPTGFEAQANLVWRNLLAQLDAAHMSVENLVKITIFLSSRSYAEINSEVRVAFLKGHVCALTVVITGIFDESWLLEVEAIAAV